MKWLTLVRHGPYETNGENAGSLTQEGKEAVNDLAEHLSKLYKAGTKTIFSSPKLRALETSEILSDVLGVPFVTQSELDNPDRQPYPDQDKLWKLVEGNMQSDVVILVGHMELFEDFPLTVGEKYNNVFNLDQWAAVYIGLGEALHLGFERGNRMKTNAYGSGWIF